MNFQPMTARKAAPLVKRGCDLVVASVLLVATAPILGILLLITWYHDGAPPVFVSKRVGFKGGLFRLFKIRTMTWRADTQRSITSQNDPRITPWGGFLRRTKLDELLQLWNVVRGDMSLVGPRPDVYEGGVSLYTADEQTILNVKPGLVDLASLFFHNEGEYLEHFSGPHCIYIATLFPLKKKLMLFYVAHHSFLLDMRLLFITARLLGGGQSPQDIITLLKSYNAPLDLIQACEQILKRLKDEKGARRV